MHLDWKEQEYAKPGKGLHDEYVGARIGLNARIWAFVSIII